MNWLRCLFLAFPLLCCGAAYFNGSSDGASTGSALSTIGSNLVTVSYLIRFESTNQAMFVEPTTNYGTAAPATFRFFSGNTAGYEDWGIHGSATVGAQLHIKQLNTKFPLSTWLHRVVVLDRQSSSTNQIRVYTNGIAAGLNQFGINGNGNGTTAFSAVHRMYFGARAENSLRLTGYMQDVAIYLGEVSAAEAYSLGAQRMSPLKVRSAKLVNYWPLNAGENADNNPDVVSGIAITSGTRSMVQEQTSAYRK